MSRSKHSRKDEELKGQLRSALAEIKRLRKQLKYQERTLLTPIEVINDLLEQEMEQKEFCPDCGHTLVISNLGIKWLKTCSSCQYRKTILK